MAAAAAAFSTGVSFLSISRPDVIGLSSGNSLPCFTSSSSSVFTPLRSVPVRKSPPQMHLSKPGVQSVAIRISDDSLDKSSSTTSSPTSGGSANDTEQLELEVLNGLPKQYLDDEWQARQRKKTAETERLLLQEEEEERLLEIDYREIGSRLKGYPEEDVRKARILVSNLIKSAEEVEEKIEEAAERGELTELVLMVIWNRLDLARRDEEIDAIRGLDLLYRRVETEILKRESTPSMRLLNDLLNLYDGYNDDEWLKQCRKKMIEMFAREDPFSMIVPLGTDIDSGAQKFCLEGDDVLLRVDFVKEVNELLREVQSQESVSQTVQGFDPESIAVKLKQQEKQRTIHLIEALSKLAMSLVW